MPHLAGQPSRLQAELRVLSQKKEGGAIQPGGLLSQLFLPTADSLHSDIPPLDVQPSSAKYLCAEMASPKNHHSLPPMHSIAADQTHWQSAQ